MKTRIGLLLICLAMVSTVAPAVDVQRIQRDLETAGVVGWIHGAVPEQKLYVFTYRNPKDFFDYLEMSLVATTPETARQLRGLARHDKVKIKGRFLDNPSPQKHVAVSSVELLVKYRPGEAAGSYDYRAKVPRDLLNARTAPFLVHSVGADGHILVVEYKDAVLPIFVRKSELAKGLYRNDAVQLAFTIQSAPGRPTHLELDESAPAPVQVLDSIARLHGRAASIEGPLVLFPKSPEILFNVFAVQQVLPGGLTRQFTLVSTDSEGLFAKLRQMLQAAWDRRPGQYVNGRNKLVSTQIRVRVTGTFNEVDPNQANAQILVPSLAAITLIEPGGAVGPKCLELTSAIGRSRPKLFFRSARRFGCERWRRL